MKILGLDPSSNIGYCILDCNNTDIKLFTYGNIVINKKDPIEKRLLHIRNELCSLLTNHPVDYCAIEEPFLGLTGVRNLIYLSRISGVVIQTCYEYTKNINLFEPNEWKCNTYSGIHQTSEKYDVQLCVYDNFKFSYNKDIIVAYAELKNDEKLLNNHMENIFNYRAKIKEIKKAKIDKSDQQNKIKQINDFIECEKNSLKNLKTKIKKQAVIVSSELAKQTLVNNDVTDSIALAYCLYKKIKNIC